MFVGVGDYDVDEPDDGEIWIQVSYIHIHPGESLGITMNQKTSEIFTEREFKFVEFINIFLACLILNSIWQWRL